MKAYKATYNRICRDLTYEVGETYTFNDKLIMCEQGFHFCKNPKDTLEWYDWSKNFVLLEIDVLGDVIDDEKKSVTNKFKVIREISREEAKTLLDVMEEYDDNNNLIHFKDYDDYEYWSKYDSNNNLIYFKTSIGSEYWYEYDSNNNLIHRHSKNNK